MITCPSCHHQNPEGSTTCEVCGQSLPTPGGQALDYRECPSCHELNPPDSPFCRHCFTELVPSEAGALDQDTPVTPYKPPQTSADEFRGLPRYRPRVDEDRPELDVTVGEMIDRSHQDTPVPPAEDEVAAVETEQLPPPEQEPEEPSPASRAEETIEQEEGPRSTAPAPSPPETAAEKEIVEEAAPTAPVEEAGSVATKETPAEALSSPEVPPPAEEWLETGPLPSVEALPETEPVAPPEEPERPSEAQVQEQPPAKEYPPGDQVQELESGEDLPEVVSPPLEGVREPIPLAPPVSLPHRALPRVTPPPTKGEEADAELLRQITEEPAPLHEPARTVAPRRAPVLSSRVGRTLMYALVLLAALTPLVTGGLTASWIEPRPIISALAEDLATPSGGAPVLISFDYTPAYGGELSPLALAVTAHLVRESVPMVIMSTQPEGVSLAQQILRQAVETKDASQPYEYGTDYVILGYLPGNEAALRTLAVGVHDAFKTDYIRGAPLTDLEILGDVNTLEDFDEVVVLADDSVAIRRWIEQVKSRRDIRLHGLVSSRVEPMLVPYWQSGQMRTLVGATYAAPQYPVASGAPVSADRASDAYGVLLVVLIGIAIATNVSYAIHGGGD